MKWSLLKQNKCPKCENDFMQGLETIPAPVTDRTQPNNKMLMHPCGFKIRERRYSQIVNSQITAGIEERLNKEFADS